MPADRNWEWSINIPHLRQGSPPIKQVSNVALQLFSNCSFPKIQLDLTFGQRVENARLHALTFDSAAGCLVLLFILFWKRATAMQTGVDSSIDSTGTEGIKSCNIIGWPYQHLV